VAPLDRALREIEPEQTRAGTEALALPAGALDQPVRDALGPTRNQFVFEAQEELVRPGIALAAGAPAKLQVDPPGFVHLRSQHVQPAALGHAPAEDDVHAPARHVGRNRHLAALAGLRDDLGLLGVVARVQDAMLDVPFLQEQVKRLAAMH